MPLVDLLNAQSSYLNARASAVSAFYTSITDLVNVERETGFLEYLRPAEIVEDFIAEMEKFTREENNHE